jgi:hypothetical protein
MCKEMPVIPVDRVVLDKKRIIRTKWRAEEEGEAQGVDDPQNFFAPVNLSPVAEVWKAR